MFTAMFTWKRAKQANPAGTMSGHHEVSDGAAGVVQPWVQRSSTASSEGERLMLEALVESSQGGRRTVLQYIKMLSVIALPVAAVIGLVSYTLHNSRVERAMSY